MEIVFDLMMLAFLIAQVNSNEDDMIAPSNDVIAIEE